MTTYKLTSDKIDGHILITFDKGLLKAFEISVKRELTAGQYGVLLAAIPFQEERIRGFEHFNLSVVPIAADRTNERIALFCRLYERYVGVKYNVSGPDAGKMKRIKVDESMLVYYFTSQNFLFKSKWSISNLVKYYNELLAEIANKGKPQFPNIWDANFAAKLQGPELTDYWKHLRSLGLKPKRDRFGNTIDWL